MIHHDKIKINDIIFVNHRIGNKKGSYTKFETDYVFHYQLLYKLSGEAIITFDRKQVTEKADCLRFLPNPAHFRYAPLYTAEVIEQGESINIGFTSDSPLSNEITVKKYDNSRILKQLFQKLQKYWYYKPDGYYYKSMSVLYDIFAEISKAETNYLPSHIYSKIQPAIEYIDNNFTNQNIDCDHLANLCNISHTYMTKLFKKRFGITPVKYIMSKKLQYACELINTRHYSINEISEIAGFSNVYYFSRVFKNNIGCSPSEYIKNAHL